MSSSHHNNMLQQTLALIRFYKPAGTFLLLFPCLCVIRYYGDDSLAQGKLALIFTIGAFIMRSAGCIINDICDRKIDAQVKRTKGRPLASGALSLGYAITVLLLLLALGLYLILSYLPMEAIYLCIIALVGVVIYPLSKRYFIAPQLVLGIVFNSGVFITYTTMSGDYDYPQRLYYLYLGLIFYTLYYDTVYAIADSDDDKKLGVKSLAVLTEPYSLHYCGLFLLLAIIMLAFASLGYALIWFGMITAVLLLLVSRGSINTAQFFNCQLLVGLMLLL
jgi:4-hydroxybenzoate polyprenyltransferase